MKSFLVPIEDHSTIGEVIETAAIAADLFGATVNGVPLRTLQFQVVGAEPIVAVSFPPADQDDSEAIAAARKIFDTRTQNRSSSGPAKFSWHGNGAVDDISLGSMARVYDLTVVGRPSSDDGGARMATLESVLFDGGRPILIAPPRMPQPFGKKIVISWNCSTEAARTLAFAMPLLQKAERVSVLTVEEAVVSGPSGADVCANLELNGITASEHTVSAKGSRPGAVILEQAKELGCDLLVKSAYTQSRLRQMIFGGATSHILANADLPVFMAN
jgi:nucleotide-binding universal stress UspA family protein